MADQELILDFLNRFNSQTALSFKSFCEDNEIRTNTAYGWGAQLGIEINSQIQYVHLLDKRCLVDGYQQQCLIDGVSFKQYFDKYRIFKIIVVRKHFNVEAFLSLLCTRNT